MSIIKLFYRNPSAPQKASSETGIEDYYYGKI